MRISVCESARLGSATFNIRHWGDRDAPLLFMVHGWQDSASTFQFLVDALREDWHIIAPDLRGHGGSHRTHEPYGFMQHMADLDALFGRYCPHDPVRLVAHSLGANVSAVYAGVRPERVSHFVNLEGLAPIPGFRKGSPTQILGTWLTSLRDGPRNRRFATHGELAARLVKANPKLTLERATWLAGEFAHERADGGLEFNFDPYQHAPVPMFGHQSVIDAALPLITARVLLVTGSDSYARQAFDSDPQLFATRLALYRDLEYVNLAGASHNLQHEFPERIAELTEDFLAASRSARPA